MPYFFILLRLKKSSNWSWKVKFFSLLILWFYKTYVIGYYNASVKIGRPNFSHLYCVWDLQYKTYKLFETFCMTIFIYSQRFFQKFAERLLCFYIWRGVIHYHMRSHDLGKQLHLNEVISSGNRYCNNSIIACIVLQVRLSYWNYCPVPVPVYSVTDIQCNKVKRYIFFKLL